MLLENDQFLLELSKLFQQQRLKNAGSLSLTMKRYDGRTKPASQLTKKERLEQKKKKSPSTSTTHEPTEYKCLVRAVFGSKKLSTTVSAKDINRFQLAYSNLLKANMDTLKKKAKETKAAAVGQTSTNVPSSPTVSGASTSATASHQPQKKTPTTPAKKK